MVWRTVKLTGWAGGILFLALLIWLLSMFGIPDFGDLVTISKRLTQIEDQADGNTASVAALQEQVNGQAQQIEALLSQQAARASEIQNLKAELAGLQELGARQAERITALESDPVRQPEAKSAAPIETPQPARASVPAPAAATEAAPGDGWLAYVPTMVREHLYITGTIIAAVLVAVGLAFRARGGSEGTSSVSGGLHSAHMSGGASLASAHFRSHSESVSSHPRRRPHSGMGSG